MGSDHRGWIRDSSVGGEGRGTGPLRMGGCGAGPCIFDPTVPPYRTVTGGER